jgi:hypothetical protein
MCCTRVASCGVRGGEVVVPWALLRAVPERVVVMRPQARLRAAESAREGAAEALCAALQRADAAAAGASEAAALRQSLTEALGKVRRCWAGARGAPHERTVVPCPCSSPST